MAINGYFKTITSDLKLPKTTVKEHTEHLNIDTFNLNVNAIIKEIEERPSNTPLTKEARNDLINKINKMDNPYQDERKNGIDEGFNKIKTALLTKYLDDWVKEKPAEQADRSKIKNSITIKNGQIVTTSNWLTIENCPKLTALPQGLTVNGWLTIDNCPKLTALPEELTVNGDLKIENCKRYFNPILKVMVKK